MKRPLATSTPATKAEAFRYVQYIRDGSELTDYQKDQLLLFFAEKAVGVPCKSIWKWLTLAVNPKDIRKDLTLIVVSDGIAYATDGHRIHRAAVDLADGYYEPKSGLKVDHDPVNPIRLTRMKEYFERDPGGNSFHSFAGTPRVPAKADSKKGKLETAYLITGTGFNAVYLEQAAASKVSITCAVKDDTLYGENELGGQFAVMAIRL